MTKTRLHIAITAVLALGLTACSGAYAEEVEQSEQSGQSAVTASSKVIRLNSTEPQTHLIPADTRDGAGASLIDKMFVGLIEINDDNNVENVIAESIENKDNKFYTVKLRKDWKFSDGTPVKAHNFTDAWRLATKTPMVNADDFDAFVGTNENGTGDLSGVKLIDDYTFTIELKRPTRDLIRRMSGGSFLPLPDSTLKDPKEGGEHPVVNGPYMPDGKDAWNHTVDFRMVPNPYYIGKHKPKNGGLRVIFYTNDTAAYRDLQSNQLDLGSVPDSQLVTYKADIPGRTAIRESNTADYLTIPEYVPHFSGEEGRLRRQAISYIINRQELCNKLYHDLATPATDFSSPMTVGYSKNLPGHEVLTYNVSKAKELWAKADAISPYTGTFIFHTFPEDPTVKALAEAVVQYMKNGLGVDAETRPYTSFRELQTEAFNNRLKGAVDKRMGGGSSLMGYLETSYKTKASSNIIGYSNTEFDQLLIKANAATTDEDYVRILQQAEEILFKDLPGIPLTNGKYVAAWSKDVTNVTYKGRGGIDITQLVRK